MVQDSSEQVQQSIEVLKSMSVNAPNLRDAQECSVEVSGKKPGIHTNLEFKSLL